MSAEYLTDTVEIRGFSVSVEPQKIFQPKDIISSVGVLRSLFEISQMGLNDQAVKLGDLVNGCDANEQPNDIIREFPKIPLKPFEKISANDKTASGKFISDLFGGYRKRTGESGEIRLIGVGSHKKVNADVIEGHVMLCNENKIDGNFICVGFRVDDLSNDEIVRIGIRDINFLRPGGERQVEGFHSFKKRFKRMSLYQQTLVVQKLFMATQIAINESLNAH